MSKYLVAFSAIAMLIALATPNPATAAQQNSQQSAANGSTLISAQDLSARRYHHRYYRYGYRRSYGYPYYAYAPAPYYYGPRYYYYRPAPFPFGPWW